MKIFKKNTSTALATMILSTLATPAIAHAYDPTTKVTCSTSVGHTAIRDKSQTNAWSAGGVTFFTAPGEATTVLSDFAQWFNNNIEPIAPDGDDWSWAPAQSLNGSPDKCDNHSSGTAIDINSNKHPFKKKGTFTAPQTRAIRDKIKTYDGAIAWGGNWTNPVDEMHFEYIPIGQR